MDNQTTNQSSQVISVSTSGPAKTEVQWPQKPKNQIRRVLFAFLAIVLVAGIAGSAYYVSSQLSTRQAVAPNAPESEPQASGGCTNNPAQCSSKETCVNGVCKKIAPPPTGYGTGYVCNSTVCPGPCFGCNSTKTSCIAYPNAAGCGGVSGNVGSDPKNCGGTGNVCPTGSTCSNGQCRTPAGVVVTPGTPTPLKITVTPPTQPGTGSNGCDGKNGRPLCAQEYCHCLNGDDCGQSTKPGSSTDPGGTYECVNNTKLIEQCISQNRSWCVNQYGSGMTCCFAGYRCNPSGPGCVGGPITTPKITKTTTPPPTTKTSTPTPPPMACTAIALFTPQATDTTCTTDTDCASTAYPEGRFCNTSTGKCDSWFPTTVGQMSSKAKVGTPIKASFTARNVSKVEAKVNNGAYLPTKKNPATGKYDFIFTIPSSGTFTVAAKYY